LILSYGSRRGRRT